MNLIALRASLPILLLAFAAVAGAQDDSGEAERQAELERQAEVERQAELERQQIFRAGFQEIVTDLNNNSFERFAHSIDQDDMLERIFGLRLIDPKIKKSFQESFNENLVGFLKSTFADTEGKIRAAWLGFGSSGERGKAIVRYDLPDFQFNYHVYELRLDRKGRVVIVDWIDFLNGEQFSDGVGVMLVRANPRQPAVRKLVDFQGPTEQQTFQMTELLKATRDRQVDRYFDILAGADEKIRKQRVTVLMSVQLTRTTRNRRKLRTALIDVDKYFPEEPLFSLMLLDYYFPARKFDQAMDSLLRLQKRLGVQDSAMSARLSAAALVLGNTEEALIYADEAVALEPGLELGWWSALRASTAAEQFDKAVEALDVLEKQFGYTLSPQAFEKDQAMAALLRSKEYEVWYLAHE